MRSRSLRASLAVAMVVLSGLVVACGDDVSPQTESSERSKAESYELLRSEGFPCRTLTVRSSDGTVATSCVWAAATPELRERGLMGVTDSSIGGGDAMAFVFPSTSTESFWMRDTPIPLTVVWVADSGAVLGSTDMVPCPSGTTCPTYAPPGRYALAVEVARGRAPELGLIAGAIVTLDGPCTASS